MNFQNQENLVERANFIASSLPKGGLFARQKWRISPLAFPLEKGLVRDLERLGRVLLQFYRSTNLLYRRSVEGSLPNWIAELFDQGKPSYLLEVQRDPIFRNEVPRVIRPDILLTENGFSITELDSVPGGIGLISWLNQHYADLDSNLNSNLDSDVSLNLDLKNECRNSGKNLIGGRGGPLKGFMSIFEKHDHLHIVMSEESADYLPEMKWIAENSSGKVSVCDEHFRDFKTQDAVYRFFELFDLENIPNSKMIFDRAIDGDLFLTPPPKTYLEEKLLFSLFWNRNLKTFWKKELGEGFFKILSRHIPYTWTMDPSPLPPHAAYPELGLTDWKQLKSLSQKERRLIVKISGFSPFAWGARSVRLGSDLSAKDWGEAVDHALMKFEMHPHILQRFTKPKSIQTQWFDVSTQSIIPMMGRVRLCPYYFVSGKGEDARARLGGCLATICPADKKIIHGMSQAIMMPCCYDSD